MQSGVTDTSGGALISGETFDAKAWYTVSVPTTILAGLLANQVYPFDPFAGQNLKRLADPRLDKDWWFRREWMLPQTSKGKHTVLKLHGINYTANVWINGTKVADSTQIKGPFRIIELDITQYVRPGGKNVLALQITRPFQPNHDGGDLAIDYADWIPYPPDYNGGIVNDVEIAQYNRVGISYPLVTTQFDLPSLAVAHLSLNARVTNYEDTEQDAVVEGTIDGSIHFKKKIRLKPFETTNIGWAPTNFPQLNIRHPRIWWPWQYGKPELNHIELSVSVGGRKSNTIAENFGIRQVDSKLIDNESREFIVNGRPIMLRGAAWSPDIFQRRSEQRQEQEIRLVRDMNMNIVRSEGKLEDDHFYELCDKYGLLLMTGWMCCGAWQHPEHWDKAERAVAMASDSSVMYWLRNKPSLLVWLNGSDMPPTDTTVERSFLNIEKSLLWPNPIIATADGRKSWVSGFSGVKMLGPYEWVPPIYWETDTTHQFGGGWSFATEISPGPSIPPYESLVKFIPADSLSAPDFSTSADWQYHAGTGFFATTNIFNKALDARYGSSASIKNYTAKAQAQNYETHRAMMEAYGLHKYNTATGVVQWMLSNPWPGLIWHTYDYYLYPSGTYFGMKKGMEPLHILYSYPTHSVAIINSWPRKFKALQVQASIYNPDGVLKYSKTLTTGIDADSAKTCFTLPVLSSTSSSASPQSPAYSSSSSSSPSLSAPGTTEGLSDTYFLRLELKDPQQSGGRTRSINWYWLSKRGDTLNWKKSNWYTTPQSAYMDYTALQRLPKTTLKITSAGIYNKVSGYTEAGVRNTSDSAVRTLRITNTGKAVAFFVHLRALKGPGGDDILPVIFEDNYLCLAPGETRSIRCSFRKTNSGGSAPYFLVSGWNLDTARSAAGDRNQAAEMGFEEGLPD